MAIATRKLVLLLTCLAMLVTNSLHAQFSSKFKAMIQSTIVDLDPSMEGGLLQTAEARHDYTFQEPKEFLVEFSSDENGGIILRDKPVDTRNPIRFDVMNRQGRSVSVVDFSEQKGVLELDYATFRLDKRTGQVEFRLGIDEEEVRFSVPATIVPAAALMATDDKQVLVTLAAGSVEQRSVDRLAIHPAVARHVVGGVATLLDRSLLFVMNQDSTHYYLCEKPWGLSLDSFANHDNMFDVRCRNKNTETTRDRMTEKWLKLLPDPRKKELKFLSDFVLVHRLINAVADGHVTGFPEDEFMKFLAQLQPYFDRGKITKEQEGLISGFLGD